MPRVTIITPAHNSAASITAAVVSVREQTLGDWEHIVADDSSRDATMEILQGLAAQDKRLRLTSTPSNLGPAGARNLALEKATGELVAFLDADDRLLPAYLQRLTALYDAATGAGRRVGIVSCDAYMEDGAGRLSGTYASRRGHAQGVTLSSLLRANTVFVSAVCPTAVVHEVGGFSTECWGSEDHDLWLRIVESGYEVIGTPDPLVVYRVAATSISNQPLGMARTTQATYRRALARGRLNSRQRRIARGELRVARAAEAFERVASSRDSGWPAVMREGARALPAFGAAALSRPGRWGHWARLTAARTVGRET